jgi:hypothetical protein
MAGRRLAGGLLVIGAAALISAASCSGGHKGHSTDGTDGGTTPGGCTGLACLQVDCGAGVSTTLTGKVYAPNGLDPVYDALVYVPTSLPPLSSTVQCEACNDTLGGTALVTTNTAVDGSFTLSDVPVSTTLPVVVQKGRFRRQITVNVSRCANTPVPKDQTRLPKNSSEGDLPKMAVGVGDFDQIECVLRSIGIDDSEFTSPSGSGSVHLYDNSADTTTAPNPLSTLLASPSKLATYNLLFLNCTAKSPAEQPTGWQQNIYQYVNSGGRLYVTDWAYDYLEQVPQFAPYIFFEGDGTETMPQPPGTALFAWMGTDLTGTLIDPTLADWMKAAGASPAGSINIIGSWALANHVSANMTTYPTRTWVQGTANSVLRPFTATFDYNMCGKVLWSSYHTQEPGGGSNANFPSYCKSTPSTMIPQEKVLEFLIFQISDCVAPHIM